MSGYDGIAILERQDPSMIPALPTTPPGVTRELGQRTALWTWILVAMALQMAIAYSAILIRIIARLRTARSLALEDYFIIIAQLCQTAQSLLIPIEPSIHNYTSHMWNLTLEQYMSGLKYLYIMNILYGIYILLIKLAILRQFLRIFAPNRRRSNPSMWYGCWILIVCNFAFYVTLTGLNIGFCSPIPRFWDRTIPGSCLDYPLTAKVPGIINSVSDFAMLVLPLWTVWGLNMPVRRKVGVMGIFGTGVFAIAASVLRTYFVWIAFEPGADMTYNIAVVQLCSWGESAMGILAFCLPVFPQFFRILKEKTSSGRYYKYNDNSPTPQSSNKDLELAASPRNATPTKAGPAQFMDVSLASFEVNRSSNYISRLDPYQERFHAVTCD